MRLNDKATIGPLTVFSLRKNLFDEFVGKNDCAAKAPPIHWSFRTILPNAENIFWKLTSNIFLKINIKNIFEKNFFEKYFWSFFENPKFSFFEI